MHTRRETGFSLIEMMVVIFVIGLSLSLVSLTINRGGPRDDLVDAVEQFMGFAQFAGERAILSGETMALMLEPPMWQAERGQNIDDIGWRYRWYTQSSEGWQEVPNLKPVSLPPTIDLLVEIDETEWDYEDQIDRSTPQIAYYPTGDITQFSIELRDERDRELSHHIEINENGELQWLEAPELPEADKDDF